MDAREFLVWSRAASASQRAEAASALARAYLHADVDEEVRAGFETAMTVLLDDSAPTVRFALADALAGSRDAPRHMILRLSLRISQISPPRSCPGLPSSWTASWSTSWAA